MVRQPGRHEDSMGLREEATEAGQDGSEEGVEEGVKRLLEVE